MIHTKFQLQPPTFTSSRLLILHSLHGNNTSGFFSNKNITFSNKVVGSRWSDFRDYRLYYPRSSRGMSRFVLFASMDDGVRVNGTPNTSSFSKVQEIRLKLDQSLQEDDFGVGLIQSLHDAARAVELAVIEHNSSSKTPWFSKAWLGVDRNAWVKTLSYQVAAYSLLQAIVEISSGVYGRDSDLNPLVQRSLLRISAPLESLIREELADKQPGAYDWFWTHQHPMVVMSFVNLLESNPQSGAATTSMLKVVSSTPGNASDLSILRLALSCIHAINKLGPAKLLCTQFFMMVPDITGGLMDILVGTVSIRHAHSLVKDIGLPKEFLLHFGPRAAKSRVSDTQGVDEITFWVDLVQKQLQQAIDRERIWSRLTTCESIEVLEKDLSIFGFFIALGRSTQSFLISNGYSVSDYTMESIIRYFIGGSVLYYPQLSSISSYQLYVEVVCEELEWLPFYGRKYDAVKVSHGNKAPVERLSHIEVVSQVLDVCSHWTNSFIKYSLWLEDPSNIKAASFLSRGHNKLNECRKEFTGGKNEGRENIAEYIAEKMEPVSDRSSAMDKNLDTFDKALESVEEAINRLESLVQELHLSNSSTGKEHLKAACSDLQKIRKLKKEAEFLEASFRAKADSLEDNGDISAQFSENTRNRYPTRRNKKFSKKSEKENGGKSENRTRGGLWNFLSQHSNREMEPYSSSTDFDDDDVSKLAGTSGNFDKYSELNEIRRFEVLRSELIELEKRVQRSKNEMTLDEKCNTLDRRDAIVRGSRKLVKSEKEENMIVKSIDKLKETTTDVWQGSQLLAIDTVAATMLVKRALTGDDLAEKEKQALRRTLTDLASVVPIGILMLLPVTAVGHAAMLAAIRRYVPALIPSTYAPERLALLRQLEQVKELESGETKADESQTKF